MAVVEGAAMDMADTGEVDPGILGTANFRALDSGVTVFTDPDGGAMDRIGDHIGDRIGEAIIRIAIMDRLDIMEVIHPRVMDTPIPSHSEPRFVTPIDYSSPDKLLLQLVHAADRK